MRDLEDGEFIKVQGSAALPYVLKRVGDVYSCTCPAWRNHRGAAGQRSCKHLLALRGEAEENVRVSTWLLTDHPSIASAKVPLDLARAAGLGGKRRRR